MIKSNAVLEGRAETAPSDLLALQFITTFRIPESVHNQMPRIISKIIAAASSAAKKAAKAAAAAAEAEAAGKEPANAAAAKFAEAEAIKGAKESASAHANVSTSATAASAWKDPDVLPSWRVSFCTGWTIPESQMK